MGSGASNPKDFSNLNGVLPKEYYNVLKSTTTETTDQSTNSLPPIRLIKFQHFKDLHAFPRYPENKEIVSHISELNRDEILVVFISHCWLRGYPGAAGYDGRPHPDNEAGDKYRLCVEGIQKIHETLAPGMKECYVWLDFGCIDQDGSPAGELKQLDKIVEYSDCIFTPIYDSKPDWVAGNKGNFSNYYEDYKAKLWNSGPHAYINRGWCRVEMFYAANIPVLQNSTAESKRHTLFAAGLKHHAAQNRRPHILYGTREYNTKHPPLILPPLQNSYFTKFHPLEGSLSVDADRVVIERLVDELKPHMKFISTGYKGKLNCSNQRHGKGIMSYESGDVYDGEWMNDLKHGKCTCTFASGVVYVGDYVNDKMCGHGTYSYASGEVYTGEYKNNMRNGHGTFHYTNGNVYEGRYHENAMAGQGTMSFANGDSYKGEFKKDRMNGQGVYTYKNGDTYDGAWVDGKKHGKGVYHYATSGHTYTGMYSENKKHGKGVMKLKDGRSVEEEYKNDVLKKK